MLILCQHTPLYLENMARVSTSTETEQLQTDAMNVDGGFGYGWAVQAGDNNNW
jgi:hypothetical protein